MREPTKSRTLPRIGGEQRIYQFANGYGASVVQGAHTYGGSDGLWELAVITFNGDDCIDFSLTYETPITDDVVGRLTEDDVDRLLAQIEALP